MIRQPLGRGYVVDGNDVRAAKTALSKAGLYRTPSHGLTPYPDEAMMQGIETVQRHIGTTPDSVMRPGDVTHRALEQAAASGGLIHVRAHIRMVNGKAVPVAAHDRQGGPRLSPPVHNGKIRGKDGHGEGHYGADRNRLGKLGKHKGVDIAVEPGKPIYSPVEGTIERVNIDPYPNDPAKRGKYSGVGIRADDGSQVRILYVDPHVRVGGRVTAGSPIGTAQDIANAYPPTKDGPMTNHVHVDVKKNGEYVDPTPLPDP